MKSEKEITVIELNRIAEYPPVQNLIKILLKKDYKVNFIGREVSNISEDIKCNDNFNPIETSRYSEEKSIYKKVLNRIHITRAANQNLKKCMANSEILWTTSMFTTCIVGKQAEHYKTVLQLMDKVYYLSQKEN